MVNTNNGALHSAVKQDSNTFLPIFLCGFLIFLAIALVAEAVGWHWRSWLPGAEGMKSMTGGVKAAVYTFMSHLQ
jgi:light-harvesting complex 1 beta chain